MPSIFIWKATEPSSSKKTIRFYSGSNWALEDNDFASKSYMYLDQIVISESDNSVITFHSKDMPQDWVGSELLEVSNVLYEHIKSDNYGTLERIGDWMRFTTKGETEFNENFLKNEFANIQKWMKSQKVHHQSKPQRPPKTFSDSHFDPQNIQLNFQEFLIKYTTPIPTDVTSVKPSDNSKPTHFKRNANNNYKQHNGNTFKSHKRTSVF